tara:strand:- start:478 stop:738 length:261 start_codon:yes stop_codon:yes gene_type:complete
MCLPGNPPTPKPQAPAPTMKAATPPSQYVRPEDLKGKETGEDDKLSTRKKKALEIKAAKEGTKQFSAIDPSVGTNSPETPSGGTNI